METPTHTAPPVALDRLVRHLIYGDIEEASLAILGEDCPSHEEYNALDVEQQTRLAAAATVAACLAGVLHPSGFILPNAERSQKQGALDSASRSSAGGHRPRPKDR
jgi:hypothetical protein